MFPKRSRNSQTKNNSISFIIIIISIAFCITFVKAQCMYTNPDTGATYDLSPLTIMAGAVDYIYSDSSNPSLSYSLNICGQSSELCEPRNGLCQVNTIPSGRKLYFGCGSGDPSLIDWFPYYPNPEADGVTMVYRGGTMCPTVGIGRQSYINVLCDEDAHIPIIDSISEDQTATCTYAVYVRTNVACTGGGSGGSGSGLDPGWIIIIISFVALVMYLIIGVIIKYKRYEARGIEMIPNIDFWKDVPFLFKDGCAFFLQKISRGRVCGEYSPVG